MPTLKEVRGRISTVRNISQITRAMEMVAASKMKRAQEAILAARPYADELRAVLERLGAATRAAGTDETHPLLARREVKTVGLIVITTDRGLAGALNANNVRAVLRFIQMRQSGGARVEAITIGRKGRDLLRRLGVPIAAHFGSLGDRPAFSEVTPIARVVTEDFLAGRYDEIDVAFSQFISTLVQRPSIWPILPIEPPAESAETGGPQREYLFEPSPEVVLGELLPHSVAIRIYRTLLESLASEQSARMVAMRNATENANELIGDLTLVYNKTRQANITREMIEIASGAEAMAV